MAIKYRFSKIVRDAFVTKFIKLNVYKN